MNVLSLCDGMSCGQISLIENGIKINSYYASEIDKNAIKVTQYNFPNTIQLGDVTKINEDILKTLPKIDLVLFGAPCRSISRASQGNKNGNKDNNSGLRGISGLFYDCVNILNYIKKNNNPNVFFLSENVINNKHDKDIKKMSEIIGVEPIVINSKLFSAQDRERNYWTNIKVPPLPLSNSLVLNDILDESVSDKCWYNKEFEFFGEDKRRAAILHLYKKRFMHIEQVNSKYFKSYTLCACRGGNHQVKVYDNGRCRKLTPNEYRKLQTIPPWYTMELSDIHIYNLCGDGWNIATITHILKGLK